MYRVGVYGHSIACWSGSNNESFVDILGDEFKMICRGVPQGSEERILVELKKSEIDAAVIFHSRPRYLYLPHCKRDISIQQVKGNKIDQLWTEQDEDNTNENLFEEEFFSYGHIKEIFQTRENFLLTVNSYKKYLWDNEHMKNVFSGSMMQIDSYCERKGIKAIHSVAWQPSWMQFRSGPVVNELLEISKTHYGSGNPNNMTLEGNRVMAEYLRPLLRVTSK